MVKELYRLKIKSFLASISLLIFVSAALFILSLSIGSSGLNIFDFLRFYTGSSQGEATQIILSMRLSRSLASYLAGLLLGLSGVLIQTMTRNPLADPYILGLSTTSLSFLAIAMILFPDLMIYRYSMILVAFTGALVGYAITTSLSRLAGGGANAIILSGVAVSFLFGGLSHILLYVAQSKLRVYYLYLLMGSAQTVLSGDLWYLAYVFAGSLAASILLHRFLNAYLYGDEYARLLGFRVDLLRIISISIVAIATAVTIAIIGIIGFIGLASPHISRYLVGHDHRFLVPASAIVGGVLTLTADILVRAVSMSTAGIGELPLGVFTSLIGSPFLAYLVIKRTRS